MKYKIKTKTIRGKITAWFAVLLIILVSIVMVLLLTVSSQVLKQDVKSRLEALVLANTEELQYLSYTDQEEFDEGDHFLSYGNGYLEIDDDFCDYKDGIYIALYQNGELIYGENPAGIFEEDTSFLEHSVRTVTKQNETYYVYDEPAQGDNLNGLWIRGIVNKQEGKTVLSRILKMMLPFIPGLAIVTVSGGWLIARKGLRPLDIICEQAENIQEGEDLSRKIRVESDSLEIQKLQSTFNSMLERLESSFETEKQFTSDASHELRTPIAVILAECEYALEEKRTEEYEEALKVIERQGKKMSDLIEELLFFSRMERKTLRLNKNKFCISALAKEVCMEQQKVFQNSILGEIGLSMEISGDIWMFGDESLISRALGNLISNAYKYGRKNGSVKVRLYEKDQKVILEVEDDGIGIAQEELTKIWERFYQVDPSRSDGGSAGLGLSIVQGIVRLHQGKAEVFSVPLKGSLFRLILPRK